MRKYIKILSILSILVILTTVTSATIEKSETKTGKISGFVFHDTNKNGIMDNDETKIPKWKVCIRSIEDKNFGCIRTDPNGSYNFVRNPGIYIIEVNSNGVGLTTKKFVPVLLYSGNKNIINFGLIPGPGALIPCACILLDIRPEPTKERGGKQIKYDIRTKVTSANTVDIEVDLNWIIKMFCGGDPGKCQAIITPKRMSTWTIDGVASTVTAQSITPISIGCTGTCDNSGHSKENPQKNVKTTYKVTVLKPGTNANIKESIDGTITITMSGDCTGTWTVVLHYKAKIDNGAKYFKHWIDWPTSNYDGDLDKDNKPNLNKDDKDPLNPLK